MNTNKIHKDIIDHYRVYNKIDSEYPQYIFNLYYLGENDYKDAYFIGNFTSIDSIYIYLKNDLKDCLYCEENQCNNDICEAKMCMIRLGSLDEGKILSTKYFRFTKDNNLYYDTRFN